MFLNIFLVYRVILYERRTANTFNTVSAMGKTFHFIDGLQPDRTSKKLMRRHVMKGKNAGKKIHRASRDGLSKDVHWIKAVNTSDPHGDRSVDLGRVDRKFGDTILTGSFPMVAVNRCSLNIINQCEGLNRSRWPS